MNESQLPSEKGLIIETLTRRHEYFQLIIDNHRRWMREANNSKLKNMHQMLVVALEGVREQNHALLKELQKPS